MNIGRMVQWFTNGVLPSIPIVGPLRRCKWRDHQAIIGEFVIVLCFSTATFWVTALLLRGQTQYMNETALSLLYQTVNAGQLFIFAVGYLGPILISAANDPPRYRTFPGRTSHFFVLTVLAIIAAALYSQVLINRGSPTLKLFDEAYLFRASIVVALLSVLLRYLTMVFRRSTLEEFDPEKEIMSAVDKFAKTFAQRHSGRSEK